MRQALAPRAAVAKLERYNPPAGPCPIDVSDNTSLFGPAPAAEKAVRSAPAEALSRYPQTDSRALCAALASYAGVRPGQVVTGCGSDDVIECALRAFGEPGDAVAFCTPTFSMLPSFARVNGLVPRAVPFKDDGGLDVRGLLETRARIVYVASPNNPTGTEVAARALLQLLSHAEGLVLVDEAYGEFAERTAVPWLERFPRLLVTRTLSKAFGLAGLRVGYGLGAESTASALQVVRGPYKVNALAERAAVAALSEDVTWVRARATMACAVRERLAEALRRAGFHPWPSGANFLCVPVHEAPLWGTRLLKRGVRVRVLPGLPGVGDALRIGVGPWETMVQVLAALRAVAEEGLSCG
jgi:histidinol-phosphate aminotransferase